MKKTVFTFLGDDCRMAAAEGVLTEAGMRVEPWPCRDCTHVVLPLPAFEGDRVRGGPSLEALLAELRPGMVVLGGNLSPHWEELVATGALLIDYFTDEELIAANGDITAEGAVALAMEKLPVTLAGAPCLVCGWGRIGQLLTRKLCALGARVTVAARKPRDLGLIRAMGCEALPMGDWAGLSQFRVIFNTVPAPILDRAALLETGPECLLIELASGMERIPERSYIHASGLPGTYAPESAGRLIGETILRKLERSSL